jgi:hypothetical protein
MLGSLAEEVHLARPRPGVRQDRKRGASMKVCRFGVSTTCSWLCPRPALVTKLQAAGVTVREDEPLEGCLRVYVDDPFGNRIELMQPDPRSDG